MVGRRSASWQALRAAVLAALTELDPYALTPGADDGAPADEYGFEADDITRRLISDGAVSTDDVDAIWQHWFGEHLSAVIGQHETEAFGRRLDLLAPRPR